MSTRWMFAALAATTLLLPSAARADDISVDFDRRADFRKFRTYAVRTDGLTDSALLDARIFDNIEIQLAAKGLTKTSENPDLTVIPRMQFDKSQRTYVYNTGYHWPYGWGYDWGYGWGYGIRYADFGWGWATTDVVVKDVVLGTLTIDLVDTTTNALVWRGTAVKRVRDDQDPEDLDKGVRRSVKKVFRRYPPGPDDLD